MPNDDVLAVIPARGGSRRVPRKNMRDVGGEPMLWWTVRAAMEAAYVDRVVVSTEDVEIAAFCRKRAVETVPQPIDSALSGTMSAPVVLSALDFLRASEGYEPHRVALLHPTSPLRTAKQIDDCVRLSRIWEGSVVSFTADDLNGAVYVCKTALFREHGSFMREPIFPYWMDGVTGLDVDTWEDLERAREYMAGELAA